MVGGKALLGVVIAFAVAVISLELGRKSWIVLATSSNAFRILVS